MATEPIRFSKATLLKMLDGRAARMHTHNPAARAWLEGKK